MQLILLILIWFNNTILIVNSKHKLRDRKILKGLISLKNKDIILIANKIESNAVGSKVEKGQITKPPYEIERCDQIVAFPGKRLLSYYDVTSRVDAYFDIGMYIINMYENEYAETLIQSIEMHTLEKVPDVIKGSGTCLKIVDDKSNIRKSFAMCLPNKETMQQIQTLFYDFMFNCSDHEIACENTKSIFEIKPDGTSNNFAKKEINKIKFGKFRDKEC